LVVLGVKRLVSAAVASIPFCHEPVQRRERAREPAIADVVPRSNGRMNSSREWGLTRFRVGTPRLPSGGGGANPPFVAVCGRTLFSKIGPECGIFVLRVLSF